MRFRTDSVRFAAVCLTFLAFCVLPLAAEEATPSELGQRVRERFEVRDLDESILLTPRAEGTAVRSIEVTEDDEVLVNDKEFDEAELAAFLGADGALLEELRALGLEGRREALGLEALEGAAREPGDIDIKIKLPVPPTPPVPPHIRIHGSSDDRVSFGRSIHLEEGESASELVCLGCSIEVDGETTGDVVAVGGSIRVNGQVGGNAVAVGGGLTVADEGVVEGDGVSVGGAVETQGSGEILGKHSSVGVGGPWVEGWGRDWGFPWSAFSDFGRFVGALLRTGLLALLAALVVLFARAPVDVAARRVGSEPWKAAFAGLLTQLLFFPVLILAVIVLAISIIGIPLLLLVPFALLALVLANFVGFVGVARALAQWLERRLHWSPSSVALSVVVGVTAIQFFGLFGRLLSLPGGWLAIVGFTLVALGFFLKYLAWTTGLGAMVLAAFSGEWRRSAAATPPPGGALAETLPGAPPPLAPQRTGEDEPTDR